MAKRRKTRRFSGTADEHSTYARFYKQGIKTGVRTVIRHATSGRCAAAAEALYELGTEVGGLVSERRGIRAEGGVGDEVHNSVATAQGVFKRRCLK